MAYGNPYGNGNKNNNPYSSYDDNKIMTASSEDLTLMLYEGGVKFCNQAIIAVEKKDIMGANLKILKCQDVVRELQITVNRKHPQADDIYNLYEYMYRRLIEANLRKDIEILQEVTDMMKEFRDLWKESVKIARESRVKK